MSEPAMMWAWHVSGITSMSKMILMAVARHADDNGRNSCASVAVLAIECRMSERSVQNHLKRLAAGDYIHIRRRTKQTNRCTVLMDRCEDILASQRGRQ